MFEGKSVAITGATGGIGRAVAEMFNAAWESSWQINVMQSVYASRVLLPQWKERGGGRLIITSSAAGLMAQLGSASYTATKHAVEAFAEQVAMAKLKSKLKAETLPLKS